VHHHLHILKYFKLSSYVCDKTVLQPVTLYFPNRSGSKYNFTKDMKQLTFVSQNKSDGAVVGRLLWKTLESQKILPG